MRHAFGGHRSAFFADFGRQLYYGNACRLALVMWQWHSFALLLLLLVFWHPVCRVFRVHGSRLNFATLS